MADSLKNITKAKGFSLIEVLISMVVMGVGLLGLAGLQVASMKGTTNAHSRNVANMLVMDLADRMRSNPRGVAGGFYDNPVSCTSAVQKCRINSFCNPLQVAKFDVQEIMCGLKRGTKREGGVKNLLLNGNLNVACPAGCGATNAIHNVTITWGDRTVHKDQQQGGSIIDQTLIVPIIP